jgi:hypothetical protein
MRWQTGAEFIEIIAEVEKDNDLLKDIIAALPCKAAPAFDAGEFEVTEHANNMIGIQLFR